MPKIKSAKAFDKKLVKYLAKHSHLRDKIKERMKLLSLGPDLFNLENHKLRGVLKNYYAITITRDCRIVFKISPSDGAFILVDIGPHDEVY